MDKDGIVQLLRNIKETGSVGPKQEKYSAGEPIAFALRHGLLRQSSHGTFLLTLRGADLLSGEIAWENLIL